ncbi:tape measure protein [Acinetobacter sp. WCHAc060007]|uniref:tape measure protein n=1 Tax=Acinetobacter sp. WCHAc060007 TaxID=2419605 RepID=UPI000EA1FE1C|nr:tape measure protein [Acinetobacter sp. WCHAc060007]RKG37874.1 phage tail tape measure protein [Acinetobacter sp. WCHAc060007]
MTTQTSRLVIEIDSRNAERNTRAVANELENLTTKGYKADAQMTEMSSSIKTLVGFMGGLLTINKAIAMADGYTQMAARIRNATSSAEEYDLVQNRVLATANTTYRSLSEAQEVYLSLSGGMKSLGKSTTQTLDLVDSLSFSFTHNATRTDQAQSAMDALSKSMAKGKVDGDAWISIVTGADNIIADMAKTTGKTEAEIRKLGAEGKASLEDLIKTLIATREQNEKLANNMENSLADGFTTLSNAVTVYLGKANESTSATGIMAGALGELAQNLESVANVAMLGGVAYLTKTILAQTVAIRGSVTESMKKNATNLSEISTNAALTASEARKTGAVAQYTTMQLADAKATAARMTGLQRLTYIQTTVIPLEAKATQATVAHTAATAADTIAQEANNKARSRSAALYNLIGGPIGAITIGITALAAGYMYFSNRAAEANAKLEEQAAVAKRAKEELLALKGLEKDDAINKMTASFERQNKALSESSSKINMQLNAIEQLYKGNKEVVQVVQDARNGTISMTEAVQRFNELRISKEVYESVKANTVEFEKNAKEATNTKTKLSLFGYEVELSGRKAQTSVAGVDGNTKALKENKTAANSAAEAQKNFKASLFDREFEALLTKGLLAKGYTPEQVANMVQTANWAQKNNVKLTNDLYQAGLQVLSIEQQNNKVIESRNKALKENTSELEKQEKLGRRLIGISGNSGVGTGAHLDVRYGGSRDGQKVSKEHLARLEAGGKSLSNYRVSSDYGNRKAPTKGASSFHKGIDFAMPVGTPITTKVAVKDIKTAYDSKGGGYYSTVTFEDGVVLKLLHQSPSMMGKVKGGASDGTLKANQDIEKQAEQQANTQLQLQMAVATERKRIETQLQEDIKEINKAGFSPEETKRLIAEYQRRADNDIAIAEYALKTKLDDYLSFKKTEDELLKDSFDQKKFYATRDIELSKNQRDQTIKYLDEEYLHELGLIKLAKEQRIFQMQQGLMNANAQSERYWELERQRIMLNVKDLDERNRQLAIAKALQEEEKQGNYKSAVQQWGSINAEMTGTTEQYNLEKERFDRLDASQALFDAELALAGENYVLKEQAYQAHVERMRAIEDAYHVSSTQLQLSYGEQMASGMATMMGAMFGEQSKAYQAAFLVEQSFAATQAALALAQNVAQASKIGFPQNIPMITAAFAQGAQIASLISSVAAPKGYATGGLIRGPGTSTSDSIPIMASDTEFMMRSAAVKSIGVDNLNYMNKYGELPENTYRVGMGTVDAINRGADVQAERQAQANVKAGAGQINSNPQHLQINNILDPAIVGDFMSTPAGTKVFMNFIKNNRSSVKAIVG